MGDVIDDVQNPEAPAIGHLVMDEVERPAGIGLASTSSGALIADRPLAAFALADPQPFFPVETVDAVDARGFALPAQQDEQSPYPNRRRSLASSLSRSPELRLGRAA